MEQITPLEITDTYISLKYPEKDESIFIEASFPELNYPYGWYIDSLNRMFEYIEVCYNNIVMWEECQSNIRQIDRLYYDGICGRYYMNNTINQFKCTHKIKLNYDNHLYKIPKEYMCNMKLILKFPDINHICYANFGEYLNPNDYLDKVILPDIKDIKLKFYRKNNYI